MATLTEYLKHLQGEYKPQPTPEPETDLTVQDTIEMLNDLGVETDDN